MNGIKKFIYILISALALTFTLSGCEQAVDQVLEDALQAGIDAVEQTDEYAPEAENDSTYAVSSGGNTQLTASPEDETTPATRSNNGGKQKKSFNKHDVSREALEYALDTIEEDGVYTTPATVAAYISTFNKLPSNFITKNEAQKLGWVSSEGNLTEVAPGKSIGGDRFGNYEGQLPKGNYRECDVNYKSGRRGAERIIYSSDGDIYYTDDHYETFTQLFRRGDLK